VNSFFNDSFILFSREIGTTCTGAKLFLLSKNQIQHGYFKLKAKKFNDRKNACF